MKVLDVGYEYWTFVEILEGRNSVEALPRVFHDRLELFIKTVFGGLVDKPPPRCFSISEVFSSLEW